MAAKTNPEKSKPVNTSAPLTSSTGGLKQWQIDLIACAVIFFAVFFLFNQMTLKGKHFGGGDDVESGLSMSDFAKEEADKGEYPYWCPYIFGGFPSLSAGAYSNYEYMGFPYSLVSKYLQPRYWIDNITENVLLLGGWKDRQDDPRFYIALLLYGGIFTYILMRRIQFGALIGIFCGLLVAWNPYLISLATARHGGKLMTIIYLPLVLLLVKEVFEKRRLLDLGLLGVVLGWQIAIGGHTQILFYSFAAIGIYFLVWAISEYRASKDLKAFSPAVWIGIALILGFGVGALWYIPLLEYVPYSVRGLGPVFDTTGQTGYSIADATNWSFHPEEILTFVVPSWFGLKSPYYWGEMPFTSSSFYFGVVPLLFAILAFWGKKDRFFKALVWISGFSILLSFGKHFEIYYRLFFDFLPFFNKFRTPSLILILVVLSGIILAGYGIKYVMSLAENDEKWKKVFLYGMIGSAAVLILMLISSTAFMGLFGDFTKVGEEARYKPDQLNQLRNIRFDMLKKDLMMSMLWLSLAFGACWMKIKGSLKETTFMLTILLITAIDLGIFSNKFFEASNPGDQLAGMRPNKVVQYLQNDKSMYRVFPLGSLIQDNKWAYWEVPSLGGYTGAKMRSYQDYQDNLFYTKRESMPVNLPLLSAMNCKYLVSDQQLPQEWGLELVNSDASAKIALYKNPKAQERVYFADDIETIGDRKGIITRLMQGDFRYDSTAIVEKSLPGAIRPSADRKATVTEYKPHLVKITANNSEPSFMVFSDTYYDLGWEAYDHGKIIEIYRVNGYVRGLYLQPGEHSIEFRYNGKYENRGMMVATLSHFLVWGFVVAGYFMIRRKKSEFVSGASK